ncbi:hypothetical protein [Micromonospora sp. DT229]|uniref:hypothetical protein n=1 Tax=Micromonospora sp. DT229 TaxID=3393430 RepID=UPI003CECCE52
MTRPAERIDAELVRALVAERFGPVDDTVRELHPTRKTPARPVPAPKETRAA